MWSLRGPLPAMLASAGVSLLIGIILTNHLAGQGYRRFALRQLEETSLQGAQSVRSLFADASRGLESISSWTVQSHWRASSDGCGAAQNGDLQQALDLIARGAHDRSISFQVTDLQGRVLATSHGRDSQVSQQMNAVIGHNVADEDWYRNAILATPEEPQLLLGTQDPAGVAEGACHPQGFVLALPVRENGQTAYVVSAHVRAEVLSDVLRDAISSSGLVTSAPRLLVMAADGTPVLPLIPAGRPAEDAELISIAHREFATLRAGVLRELHPRDPKDATLFAAATDPISQGEPNPVDGWVFTAIQPRQAALSAVSDLKARSLSAGFASLAGICCILLVLAPGLALLGRSSRASRSLRIAPTAFAVCLMVLAGIAGAKILRKQSELQQTYDHASEVMHSGAALQAAFDRVIESVADSLFIQQATFPSKAFEQDRFAVEARLDRFLKGARAYRTDPGILDDINADVAEALLSIGNALSGGQTLASFPRHQTSDRLALAAHRGLMHSLTAGDLSLSSAEEKVAQLTRGAGADMERLVGQAKENFRTLAFLAAAVVICAISAIVVGFRAIQDLEVSRAGERRLRDLNSLPSGGARSETFGALASSLGRLTGCRWVIVGRVKDEGGVVRTLALWDADHLTVTAESSLANTPCGAVVSEGALHVEQGIRQRFPDDDDLRRMQAVGYSGHALRDPDGKAIGVLILIDSKPLRLSGERRALFETYARKAEIELSRLISIEALTASETLHRMVLASLADGVITVDRSGVIQSMNPAAERLFGWTAGELVGLKIWSLISPGYHETLRQTLVRHQSAFLSSRTERGTVEIEGIHSTGFNFPLDVSLSCHAVEDEVIYTAILRDTSERRRMESEVRRLARAAESAADAIIMSDRLGQIIWVNSAFMAITGYTKEEAIGRNPRLLKSDLQAPEFYKELWTTIGSGRPWSGQLINRRKDQSLYHASLTIAPLFNRAGEMDGYVAVQRDVTSLVEREKELIRLQQELQRKADLSEKQNKDLELAREAAIEASRIKSEFLANMSHEIRTPMNGVLGFVDLLLETDLNREQRDYLDTVRVSGESLMVVINDILDFSKIEAGKFDLECTEFDLRELVESVGDLLAPSAQDKGLEFICAVSPDAPSILRGDPTRLRQVLINLTANAIKFTDQGEVCLYAERGRIQNGCSSVQFRVADTGIGIPMEQRKELFQPFSQLDGSTTRRHGGTGLGLAISQRLVGLMNGHIELESVPGAGSVFTVHLRMDMSKDAPVDLHFLPAGMEGARVLVVDDNRTNRIHLQAMLESFGCETVCIADPDEAVRIVEERDRIGRSFSFVLLDHDIAGISARDVALRLRANGCASPFISMGIAKGSRPDPAVFQAATSKPIKQFALFEAVAQLAVGQGQPGISEEPEELPPQRAHAHPGKPLHILLAEDNPINQKVATVLLERMGHRVVVASNGTEAVEAARKAFFDVILMDVQMPVLDGYEATAHIRATERGESRIPIIAMTARAMKGDRELCIEAGMDDYVTKPIRQKALEAVLQRWSQSSGPDRMLGSTPTPDAEAMLDALFVETTSPAPSDRLTAAGDLGAFFGPRETASSKQRHSEIMIRLEEIGIIDNTRLMSETLGAFIPDSRRAMDNLRTAIDSRDPVACERIAHRLRGACLNLGATRLGEMAGIIEEKGRRGDLADAEGIYSAMTVLFSELLDFLEGLLRERAA